MGAAMDNAKDIHTSKTDDINPLPVILITLMLLAIMVPLFLRSVVDDLTPNVGYGLISVNTFDRLSPCQKGIVQAEVKQSGQPADENVLKAANWICGAVARDRVLLKKTQATGGSPYLIRAYQRAIQWAKPTIIVDQLTLNAHNFGRAGIFGVSPFRGRFDSAYSLYLPEQIQHRYRQHLKHMERNGIAAAEQ